MPAMRSPPLFVILCSSCCVGSDGKIHLKYIKTASIDVKINLNFQMLFMLYLYTMCCMVNILWKGHSTLLSFFYLKQRNAESDPLHCNLCLRKLLFTYLNVCINTSRLSEANLQTNYKNLEPFFFFRNYTWLYSFFLIKFVSHVQFDEDMLNHISHPVF